MGKSLLTVCGEGFFLDFFLRIPRRHFEHAS